MKVQVLSKTKEKIKLLVEGITPAFANELRRIIATEIPTMAIEWVDFKKNDSVLNDEIVTNRLGQVPLTFDKKSYNLPKDCKCEGKGCSNCQVKLTLKKKGPNMVYSEDLKSKSKDVQPVFDKIPIVELFEGQEIEFEATAQLGLGKEHVKWQGAVVGYKNKVEITIGRDIKNIKECKESCPVNVYDIEGSRLVAARPLDCDLTMKCVEVSDGKIKVEAVKDSFIFNVETASGLSPEELVTGAAEILEEKMKEFDKLLKKV